MRLKEKNEISLQVLRGTKNRTQTKWATCTTASYQRNVVQDEAKGGGSFCEVLTDLSRHKFSLGDELAGIETSL